MKLTFMGGGVMLGTGQRLVQGEVAPSLAVGLGKGQRCKNVRPCDQRSCKFVFLG